MALLATDGVEQVKLTDPWEALKGAGAEVELISLEPGEIQGVNHHEKGDIFPVDREVGKANPDNYDALVLPGEVANPDNLRVDEDAVKVVRSFFDAGKPVAAICHGPWMLVEADVVRGRTSPRGPA